MALADGHDLNLLTLDYLHPARHREYASVAEWRRRYLSDEIRHLRISLPLSGVGDEGPRITPARNQVFVSMALNWAAAERIDQIWIGINAADHADYIDCRPDWLDAMDQLARPWGVTVRAPLIGKTKDEILTIARDLDVDMSIPWSCYEGQPRPCGTCNSCLSDPRRELDDWGTRPWSPIGRVR